MNKKYVIGFAVVVILIIATLFIFRTPAATETSDVPITSQPSETTLATTSTQIDIGIIPSAPPTKTFTLAEIAKHNSTTSCYAAVEGNVYDLTSWISRHPGGPQRIIGICGTDATKAFTAQHDGQSRPEQQLATFKIGTLQ